LPSPPHLSTRVAMIEKQDLACLCAASQWQSNIFSIHSCHQL
jgi:hypothetical protein